MTVIALLGCLGEAAILGILIALLRLSAKLGAVQRWKRWYLGYYPAIGLVGMALVMRLFAASLWYDALAELAAWSRGSPLFLLIHHGLLALGVTIAAPLTVRYWGWLLRER